MGLPVSMDRVVAALVVLASGVTGAALLWSVKGLDFDRARERRLATLKGIRFGAYAVLVLGQAAIVAVHGTVGSFAVGFREAQQGAALVLCAATLVSGLVLLQAQRFAHGMHCACRKHRCKTMQQEGCADPPGGDMLACVHPALPTVPVRRSFCPPHGHARAASGSSPRFSAPRPSWFCC